MATQTLSIDNYQDGQQVRHFLQKFIWYELPIEYKNHASDLYIIHFFFYTVYGFHIGYDLFMSLG